MKMDGKTSRAGKLFKQDGHALALPSAAPPLPIQLTLLPTYIKINFEQQLSTTLIQNNSSDSSGNKDRTI